MPQRYEYKIVRVPASKQTIGHAKEKTTGPENYESVIHDHAAQGWRLVALWSPPAW